MTGEQALACIEQERLDVMAEGMTADECENMAAYVLASEYRKLLIARSEIASSVESELATVKRVCGEALRRVRELESATPSAGVQTFAPAELLDKCIMALSGEYVEKPDDAGEEWNAAVGYCIGKLRVMQEQLPVVSQSATGRWIPAREKPPTDADDGNWYIGRDAHSGNPVGMTFRFPVDAEFYKRHMFDAVLRIPSDRKIDHG